MAAHIQQTTGAMEKCYAREAGLALISAVVLACAPLEHSIAKDTTATRETDVQAPGSLRPVTVAFIGDQGLGRGARAVLQLIKAEGTDLVVHLGDLDYEDDPAAWDALITEILGADFPVLVAVGNNDEGWYGPDRYQDRLTARLGRVSDADCSGDLGVRSTCTFRDLFFILSGVGTIPDQPDHSDHVSYIRDQLAQSDSVWRICAWHKNQRLMQLGRKRDEVGWQPYEACREGGAIVATAHEHSYSRTHLMDHFETQSVAAASNTLVIDEGKTFAFVSGLGGRSIRRQRRDGPWWASVYTRNQDANFGALFCAFFVEGDPDRARCFFKDIAGHVPDRFEMISALRAP